MKIIYCGIIGFILAGCSTSPTAQQIAELKAKQAAEDAAVCANYGLKPGSGAYAQCRLTLEQIRQDKEIADKANRIRTWAALYSY